MPIYSGTAGTSALTVLLNGTPVGSPRAQVDYHDSASVTHTIADDGTEIDITPATVAASSTQWQVNPRDHKLLAWSYPPYAATPTSINLTAGTVYWSKLPIWESTTISNVCYFVAIAGSASPVNCFLGLYTIAAGTATRVAGGITADQAATMQSTGLKQAAITATAVTSGTFMYVAMVIGTQSGTAVQLARGVESGTAAFCNLGLANTDGYMAATGATAQTTVPLSYALSSHSILSQQIWVGLS